MSLDIMNLKSVRYLKSSLESYDILCGNKNLEILGVPTQTLITDAGKSMSSKTILNLQKMYSFIQQTKRPGIYIDTDGGFEDIFNNWKPVFDKRFGITVKLRKANWLMVELTAKKKKSEDEDEGETKSRKKKWVVKWQATGNRANDKENEFNIYLVDTDSLSSLFNLFGKPITFKISEKGRFDPVRHPFDPSLKEAEELDIDETPLGLLVKQVEPCSLVLDSVLEPIKRKIPSTQENNGCKSFLIHTLMGDMTELGRKFDLAISVVSHSSVNEAQGRMAVESPSGGSAVFLNSRILIFIRAPWKNVNKEVYRIITVFRHSNKKIRGESFIIKLTDQGFVDVAEEELKKAGINKKQIEEDIKEKSEDEEEAPVQEPEKKDDIEGLLEEPEKTTN